jgi:hypothetical protein
MMHHCSNSCQAGDFGFTYVLADAGIGGRQIATPNVVELGLEDE